MEIATRRPPCGVSASSEVLLKFSKATLSHLAPLSAAQVDQDARDNNCNGDLAYRRLDTRPLTDVINQ